MDFVTLHRSLAITVTAAVVLVALESAVRVWFQRPPGRLTTGVSAFAMLALMITIGGGLGLFARGIRPRETLHIMYAVLALATIPVVEALTVRASPRMRGLATMLAALFALVLIWRLFSTG